MVCSTLALGTYQLRFVSWVFYVIFSFVHFISLYTLGGLRAFRKPLPYNMFLFNFRIANHILIKIINILLFPSNVILSLYWLCFCTAWHSCWWFGLWAVFAIQRRSTFRFRAQHVYRSVGSCTRNLCIYEWWLLYYKSTYQCIYEYRLLYNKSMYTRHINQQIHLLNRFFLLVKLWYLIHVWWIIRQPGMWHPEWQRIVSTLTGHTLTLSSPWTFLRAANSPTSGGRHPWFDLLSNTHTSTIWFSYSAEDELSNKQNYISLPLLVTELWPSKVDELWANNYWKHRRFPHVPAEMSSTHFYVLHTQLSIYCSWNFYLQ